MSALPSMSAIPSTGRSPMISARRLLLNLTSNVLSFGISVLVGIWLTPYLIRRLGVGAYGLIPLTTSVTSYLAIFTVALNSAVGRFMTIALDRKDETQANRVFNTSFWGSAAILLLISGPCLWLAFHADLLFQVPEGSERDATRLFLATIVVFFLTTIGSAFSVSSFCRGRFDLLNGVNILNTLVRVAFIVLFFNWFTPRVWHVGCAMVTAMVVSTLGAVWIWRRLTPMLRLRPSFFSLVSLREMAGTGSWIVVNMVGALLYLSIDLIVVNRIVGPEATGRYGAVMTWSALLRGLGGAVGGVFGPTIITLHSQGDTGGLVQYSRRAVKFIGLVLSIPIGLICGMSKPLLHLWLGDEFTALAPLLSLMTFHLSVNLAVLPLFNIQVATNRVRLPGIVTCVMGMLNLALAVVLAGPAGWGMYGVAAAGAIMLTAKNLAFTPVYAARVLKVRRDTFFVEIAPLIGVTLAVAGLGWLLSRQLDIRSWFGLVGVGSGLAAAAAGFILAVMLTPTERAQALRIVTPWRREPGA
jgi:membrane protein EpsK